MRMPLPGESDPFYGARDDIEGVAIVGTVTAVNTHDGLLTIQLGTSLGTHQNVKLPLGQFSFNATQSSWFRFMPQQGDRLRLVRGVDGEIHPLNWECLNYKQLSDANDTDNLLFRELKEGELEIRSKGNATIFASERGQLRLAGGPCTITLNRDTLEAEHDSPLHHIFAVGNELRFGEVRRKNLPTDFEESALAGGVQRELKITVARSVGIIDTKIVDLAFGDVVDDTTPYAPTLSENGLPVRVQATVLDDAGATSQFQSQVDNLGNVKVEALLGLLHILMKNVVIQPSTTLKVGSSSSTENMVLGQQLNTFLQSLTDALVSATISTPMGPGTFSPATIAQLQQLKSTYLSSNVILSDYAYVSKLPTPGT